MAVHQLEPTPETVTQFFSPATPAVLTVDPGDTLVIRTLDARGHLARPDRRASDAPKMFNPRRGHCLAGPIAVRGAEPGMTLAVHLRSVRPAAWGFTEAGAHRTDLNERLGVTGGPTAFLVWDLDPVRLTGTWGGLATALAPFLGVIGMPPAEPGEYSTEPPRAFGGGNIDCRELVAGSTLYLPITVSGAMLCVGDGHAAQGDGEVSGTAIECGMTSELEISLVTDPPLPSIHATTPAGKIAFGFSPDLNEATTSALDAMVTWLTLLLELNRPTALALASVAVSLRVTQVVNETWGVHALLPDGVLGRAAQPGRARMSA
jgi:acetamidase/formamidase